MNYSLMNNIKINLIPYLDFTKTSLRWNYIFYFFLIILTAAGVAVLGVLTFDQNDKCLANCR